MSFDDTLTTTNVTIDALRMAMDKACRDGVANLAAALFVDEPLVASVSWTQNYDPSTGFSLGAIHYTTVGAVDARTPLKEGAGPGALKEFAGFLRSIAYHLYCAYGHGVTVTITPKGISTQAV